jgi:hypothetical protein
MFPSNERPQGAEEDCVATLRGLECALFTEFHGL